MAWHKVTKDMMPLTGNYNTLQTVRNSNL